MTKDTRRMVSQDLEVGDNLERTVLRGCSNNNMSQFHIGLKLNANEELIITVALQKDIGRKLSFGGLYLDDRKHFM
jgi:hypothetical protein